MKLVTYKHNTKEQLAFLVADKVVDCNLADAGLPTTMNALLNDWQTAQPIASKVYKNLLEGKIAIGEYRFVQEVELMAPVPFPASCRDGYAFRQHVETARRNRGLAMIPEFDRYPVFYFTNHQSIKGPGPVYCMPDHFQKLDFELEVAIVICKEGRNIRAKEADSYIGGLMIMNDLSARTLQMEEMLLNLGPAKGKDFATVLGPQLVTLDELGAYEVAPKENHVGKTWHLEMKCSVNGTPVSSGNLADMDWTFAELIERCSYGVTLYPGDVIGSGTVGTGCFLELNGTGKRNNPNYPEQWLQVGDRMELEVEGLGKLINTIEQEEADYSLLALKKM